MRKVNLVTSNENKLKEFIRFGLSNINIEKGKDLKEVNSTPVEVIVYKALEAGKEMMVEDTSLHIQGEDVGVNIRWLLNNLSDFAGKKAVWEVLLGYHNGQEIEVYQGIIEGTITDKFKDNPQGFGFDSFFIPLGQEDTLFELEEKEMKDNFSARKNAVDCFINKQVMKLFKVEDIPVWKGSYQ